MRDGGSGEGTGRRAGDCRAGSEVEAWGDSSAVRGRLVRLRRRRKRQEQRRAGVRGFPAAAGGRRGAYGVRACGMEDGGGANRRGGACQRRSEGSGCFLFLERCGRKVDAGKDACAGRRPRRRDGARTGEAGRGDGGAEDAKAARGRESVAAAGDAGEEFQGRRRGRRGCGAGGRRETQALRTARGEGYR